MGSLKKKPVDYEKLKALFIRRGLKLESVSIEMGHTGHFLSHSKETGHLSNAALKMLDMMYNVKYDEIKPDEPASDSTILEPVRESKPDFDYDILQMTIMDAVMLANKNTDYNALREMLAYAVETAIRNVINDKAVQIQLATWLTRCNSDGWKMAWRDKLEQQAEANRRAR